MPLCLLAALAIGRGCPEYEIPGALSELGVSTRNCYFGSQEAADNALREAAKEAGCFTDNEEPPGCVCPTDPPESTDVCQSWAVNLVRLYSYDPAEESAFVHGLAGRLATHCKTSGGVLLAPETAAGIDADPLLPACERVAPAKVADLASFTAYMAVFTTAYIFVVIENQLTTAVAGKQ